MLRSVLAAAAGLIVGVLLVAGLAGAHDDEDGVDHASDAHDGVNHTICDDLTGDHHLACTRLSDSIILTQDWVQDIEGYAVSGTQLRALAARVDGNQTASLANLSLYNDLVERIDALEGHVHATGPPASTTTTTTTTTVAPPPAE